MSHIKDPELNLQTIGDYTSKLLKSILPVISIKEIKKIIPIFSLFFLISFVYHILRCLKITLIVKADGSGAEVIPFVKFWLVNLLLDFFSKRLY